MSYREDLAYARARKAHIQDRLDMVRITGVADPEAECIACRSQKIALILTCVIVVGGAYYIYRRANRGA